METTVQTFLASYSPEVRGLALKLRALVLAIIPNALEQVDPPDKVKLLYHSLYRFFFHLFFPFL